MTDLELNWQVPWLRGFEHHGKIVLALWRETKSLPEALNQYASSSTLLLDSCDTTSAQLLTALHGGVDDSQSFGPLKGLPRFVLQANLPEGVAYESFIYNTHCVPTRENWHDFFNAMCWIRFPLTKSFLNAQQALTIKQLGHVKARGSLRDALTLLDENACFVWCEEPMWSALKSHDWLRAFWLQREQWGSARVELFGHALLEKLCNPYKAITAHALRVGDPNVYPNDDLNADLNVYAHASSKASSNQQPNEAPIPEKKTDQTTDQRIDQAMLATLQALPLSVKPFQALPVLGIPGWHEENQVESFYLDEKVFRPQRVQVVKSI